MYMALYRPPRSILRTLGARAKNDKKNKIKKESFSVLLLPISFHLDIEALVPSVCFTHPFS